MRGDQQGTRGEAKSALCGSKGPYRRGLEEGTVGAQGGPDRPVGNRDDLKTRELDTAALPLEMMAIYRLYGLPLHFRPEPTNLTRKPRRRSRNQSRSVAKAL